MDSIDASPTRKRIDVFLDNKAAHELAMLAAETAKQAMHNRFNHSAATPPTPEAAALTVVQAYPERCDPVPAVEMDGNTIRLDAGEMRKCGAGGGCVVMTVDVLRGLLNRLKTCGRDWT